MGNAREWVQCSPSNCNINSPTNRGYDDKHQWRWFIKFKYRFFFIKPSNPNCCIKWYNDRSNWCQIIINIRVKSGFPDECADKRCSTRVWRRWHFDVNGCCGWVILDMSMKSSAQIV